MDVDFDIYENLPSNENSLSNEADKLQEQVKHLEEHTKSLETDIEKLCTKITEMKKISDNLTKNISELYKTAKAEIERKDRTISELRSQLDQLILKRKVNDVPIKRPRDETINSCESASKKQKRDCENRTKHRRSPSPHKRNRSRSRSKDRKHEKSKSKHKKEHKSDRRDSEKSSSNRESSHNSKSLKKEEIKQKSSHTGNSNQDKKLNPVVKKEEVSVKKDTKKHHKESAVATSEIIVTVKDHSLKDQIEEKFKALFENTEVNPIETTNIKKGGVSTVENKDVKNLPLTKINEDNTKKKLPVESKNGSPTKKPTLTKAKIEDVTKKLKQKLEEHIKSPEENKTGDSVQKTGDPVQKTGNLVQKREDPVQKLEDPVQKREDLVQKSEDLVQKTEDPLQKTEDPLEKTEDPLEKTEDPLQKTEDLVQTLEDSMQETEVAAVNTSVKKPEDDQLTQNKTFTEEAEKTVCVQELKQPVTKEHEINEDNTGKNRTILEDLLLAEEKERILKTVEVKPQPEKQKEVLKENKKKDAKCVTESKPKKKDPPPKKETKEKSITKQKDKFEEEIPESDRVLRSATRRNSYREKLDKSMEQDNKENGTDINLAISNESTVNLTHEGDIPILHISESERFPHEKSLFDMNLNIGTYASVATSSPILAKSVDLEMLKEDLNISLDQSIDNTQHSKVLQNSGSLNVSSADNSAMNSSIKRRRVVVVSFADE